MPNVPHHGALELLAFFREKIVTTYRFGAKIVKYGLLHE